MSHFIMRLSDTLCLSRISAIQCGVPTGVKTSCMHVLNKVMVSTSTPLPTLRIPSNSTRPREHENTRPRARFAPTRWDRPARLPHPGQTLHLSAPQLHLTLFYKSDTSTRKKNNTTVACSLFPLILFDRSFDCEMDTALDAAVVLMGNGLIY